MRYIDQSVLYSTKYNTSTVYNTNTIKYKASTVQVQFIRVRVQDSIISSHSLTT